MRIAHLERLGFLHAGEPSLDLELSVYFAVLVTILDKVVLRGGAEIVLLSLRIVLLGGGRLGICLLTSGDNLLRLLGLVSVRRHDLKRIWFQS